LTNISHHSSGLCLHGLHDWTVSSNHLGTD